MNDYGADVLPQHAKLLRASAITPKVASAAGIRSAQKVADLPQAFRSLGNAAVPALVFPWHRVNGDDPVHQIRPDIPATRKDGTKAKYLFPPGVGLVLGVHPDMRERVRDGTEPILIVEGTKQYLAAVSALASEKYAAAGIAGCYGWSSDGKPIPDLAHVPWDRDVYVCFDADVESNRSVWDAATAFTEVLTTFGANSVRYIKVPGVGTAGLDDVLGTASDPAAVMKRIIDRARERLPRKPAARSRGSSAPYLQAVAGAGSDRDESSIPAFDGTLTGAQVLDQAVAFIGPYLVLPSEHCLTVLALWAAHTWAADQFYVTPRLIVDSAEPSSGKSRVLELLALVTYRPKATISITTPALYRRLAKAGKRAMTILFDETDAIFNPRTAPQYEDLRAMLNAGYKRGATVDRCVGEGSGLDVVEFPVFAPVALAGLAGYMPATITTRAAAEIHMRKRAQHETVQGYYEEDAERAGAPVHDLLGSWVESVSGSLGTARPEMPDGVVDRAAENWRALLAIADAAGGDWPERARNACRWFVLGTEHKESFGVRLLRDLRHVFTKFREIPPVREDDEPVRIPASFTERLPSTEILTWLTEGIEDSPWTDIKGKPLDAVRLADELKRYGVETKTVRIPDPDREGKTKTAKGYYVLGDGGLGDAWSRYLSDHEAYIPDSGDSGNKSDNAGRPVTGNEPVTAGAVTGSHEVTDPSCNVTAVTAVTAETRLDSNEVAESVSGNGFWPAGEGEWSA